MQNLPRAGRWAIYIAAGDPLRGRVRLPVELAVLAQRLAVRAARTRRSQLRRAARGARDAASRRRDARSPRRMAAGAPRPASTCPRTSCWRATARTAARAAFEVLVPFQLDDGRVIIVDRGWEPPGEHQPDPDSVPAAPRGEVTVIARLRPGEPLPPSGRGAPPGRCRRINLPLDRRRPSIRPSATHSIRAHTR